MNKKVIAVLGYITALIAGVYVGLIQCMVMGIVRMISIVEVAFKTGNFEGMEFFLNFIRFIGGSIAGYITFWIVLFPFILIVGSNKRPSFKKRKNKFKK